MLSKTSSTTHTHFVHNFFHLLKQWDLENWDQRSHVSTKGFSLKFNYLPSAGCSPSRQFSKKIFVCTNYIPRRIKIFGSCQHSKFSISWGLKVNYRTWWDINFWWRRSVSFGPKNKAIEESGNWIWWLSVNELKICWLKSLFQRKPNISINI